MKKKFLRLPLLLSAVAIPLCCTLLLSSRQHEASPETAAASLPETVVTVTSPAEQSSPLPADDTEEMRGVWIPYMTLQLAEEERTEQAFRKKIDIILDTCVQYHLNTVIVQVRPFGDAIYPSEFYPWSHILSGTQGKAVPYDPMDIIVRAAHHRHLAVHAWINPFRISTGQTPPSLSADNPYCRWQNDNDTENDVYTFAYQDGLYYNPAYPEVRKLIIDGVRELVSRYPLEGIQIDDYFYPSEEAGYDRSSYNAYCQTMAEGCVPLSLHEWRKNNVNMLIAGMYRAIHQTNPHTVFGIAPQCNFDNNEKLSADVLRWCSDNGYIDYLCPQMYISMNHPVFPFRDLAERWCALVEGRPVKLYFGLALYKIGTEDDGGTWLSETDNIPQEIAYLRQCGVKGYMLYAYDYLDRIAISKLLN